MCPEPTAIQCGRVSLSHEPEPFTTQMQQTPPYRSLGDFRISLPQHWHDEQGHQTIRQLTCLRIRRYGPWKHITKELPWKPSELDALLHWFEKWMYHSARSCKEYEDEGTFAARFYMANQVYNANQVFRRQQTLQDAKLQRENQELRERVRALQHDLDQSRDLERANLTTMSWRNDQAAPNMLLMGSRIIATPCRCHSENDILDAYYTMRAHQLMCLYAGSRFLRARTFSKPAMPQGQKPQTLAAGAQSYERIIHKRAGSLLPISVIPILANYNFARKVADFAYEMKHPAVRAFDEMRFALRIPNVQLYLKPTDAEIIANTAEVNKRWAESRGVMEEYVGEVVEEARKSYGLCGQLQHNMAMAMLPLWDKRNTHQNHKDVATLRAMLCEVRLKELNKSVAVRHADIVAAVDRGSLQYVRMTRDLRFQLAETDRIRGALAKAGEDAAQQHLNLKERQRVMEDAARFWRSAVLLQGLWKIRFSPNLRDSMTYHWQVVASAVVLWLCGRRFLGRMPTRRTWPDKRTRYLERLSVAVTSNEGCVLDLIRDSQGRLPLGIPPIVQARPSDGSWPSVREVKSRLRAVFQLIRAKIEYLRSSIVQGGVTENTKAVRAFRARLAHKQSGLWFMAKACSTTFDPDTTTEKRSRELYSAELDFIRKMSKTYFMSMHHMMDNTYRVPFANWSRYYRWTPLRKDKWGDVAREVRKHMLALSEKDAADPNFAGWNSYIARMAP